MSKLLSRREFLISSAALVGGTLAVGGVQDLLENLSLSAPEVNARFLAGGNETFVPTVCLLCPSGCGMIARVVDGRVVKFEGNAMHPVNTNALCPKGQAAPELLYNPDRLTGPLRRVGDRGGGEWEPITWDESIQAIVDRISSLRTNHQPQRTAFMYGETRGQMRGLIDHFMSAIGSPNAVSHDSLNIEAAKLAMYLTQGIYDLPAYDFENTNYILSFGANLTEAGRNPQRTIAGYAFMRRGRSRRGKLVMIDPRQGITGAKADEWIPIKPGTDGALALSLAHVLIATGQFDSDFALNYGYGFTDFVDDEGQFHQGFKSFVLENYAPSQVEYITGVSANTIYRLAGEFAENSPSIAIMPGKGGLLNGSINGLYTAMAIHTLNALVGSIERRGGVMAQRYMPCPEWPTLPSDPIAEMGRDAERVDGAGTVFPVAQHAYQAVADRILGGYPIDLLFLYDANPVFETPGGHRFIDAFNQIDMVVSFSSFMDDSAQYADLILPEPTFMERYQDDHIEGLGYPGIGLRQPIIEPRFDTMSTGDLLIRVAHQLGSPVADAFPWNTFEELLQDRLSLIGTSWDQLRSFGVWLTPGYRFSRRGSQTWMSDVIGAHRQKSPRDGRFDFYSRELRCLLQDSSEEQLADWGISTTADQAYLPHYEAVHYAGDEADYPLLLNVITLMSLGSNSANANMPTMQEINGMTVGETWNSWVEMNPETAEHLHLHDGEQVWIESEFGRIQTKLRYVEALRPDVVNVPYNQGHTAVGRWAKDRGVNGFSILNPASEPITGLASITNTRVHVYKVEQSEVHNEEA